MKFSSKIQRCGLSPMRKFAPYAVKAEQAGKKIYHLNIGQPDIETPPAYFEAVKEFSQKVLAYAPSAGVPELIEAIRKYYAGIGAELTDKNILISTGGSEALQMALSCILDEGDEIIIPEPFYPNYSTFVTLTGASIRPLTTRPEEGYKFVFRDRVEALINEHTRAIMFTNPGNPTGAILTPVTYTVILAGTVLTYRLTVFTCRLTVFQISHIHSCIILQFIQILIIIIITHEIMILSLSRQSRFCNKYNRLSIS